MMINIFNELKVKDKFSHNEQIIADYILNNPLEVLEMNAKELSQECYVSIATIYRLCEKLDISGFSELKIRISNSIHNYQKDDNFNFNFPVKEYQTHYEIIGKLKEDYDKTINSTSNLFSLEQLKLVVNAMKKAKYIDIYTSAGNIYFALNFKFQMKEIGIEVNVPIEEYQQRLYAASSNKEHFSIIISFEGRGMLSNLIAKILKENKSPLLLISSFDAKLQSVEPTYNLYISPYENHYNKISSYSTRLSILFILDVLYTCYFELEYKTNLDKKINYYKKINPYLK